MSRSGYDCCVENDWSLIRYRGQVASATRGKRGQALLRAALEALDALEDKRLAQGNMTEVDGCRCMLGVVAATRGQDEEAARLDALYDIEDDVGYIAEASSLFDIAEPLVREIVFENDECGPLGEAPERRFTRMRKWLMDNIRIDPPDGKDSPPT